MTGEVERLRRSGRGHLYFELVEKGTADDIVAKLEAVVWRSDLEQIERELERHEQRLADGVEIRCRAQADFYPPFGRLQIVVRRVDPDFTLGLLSKRRRETLKQLAASGLLEANKKRELARVPLRVGLVTSVDSAAYHDFVSTLRQSEYAFDVQVVHSSVQGRDAERELLRALARAAELEIDCLVLVRGGGSRTDLAVFDSRSLAEALARFRVPVVTGLGHEIDEAVADVVAHSSTKTPTQAAEFLVARVRETEARVATIAARLTRRAGAPLVAARAGIARLSRGLALARFRVAGARAGVESLGERLLAASGKRLDEGTRRVEHRRSELRAQATLRIRQASGRLEPLAPRAARAATSELRRGGERIKAVDRICRQLSPEKTLRRGFSITRTENGKVARSSAELEIGEPITTQLAEGTVRSRVEPS